MIDEIAAHAREEIPRECCGVLLGKGTEIVESVRTRNLADDPNRYVLDPQGHIAARRAARRRGLAVVGFYHSHPDHPARPSQYDLDHAFPFFWYVIVSIQQAQPEKMTVWRLADDRSEFREATLST